MGNIIDQIEKDMKPYYKGLDLAHDWGHIQRVRKFALFIGKQEQGNLKVLEIAALMHDIGRKEAGDKDHGIKSWEMAKELLNNYELTEDEKHLILDAIKAHSFYTGIEPKTKEGIILRDADKLDLSGAMGIARILVYYGQMEMPFNEIIEEYRKKLIEGLKTQVKTETAKKIVDSEYPLTKEFYDAFKKKLEDS